MNKIKRLIKKILYYLGIDRTHLILNFSSGLKTQLPEGDIKLNIGSGSSTKSGFLSCDMQYNANIDILCKSWEISKYCREVSEIYSRHMLEHLSLIELERTLNDWFKCLKINGTLDVIVPNLEFHMNQLISSSYSYSEYLDKKSKFRWGLAGLYGWQRDSERLDTEIQNYWDVHKIGFNDKLLTFFLKKAGFSKIKVETNGEHLYGYAVKKLCKGERQVTPFLEEVRADHRGRYKFASKFIEANDRVMDAACGIGYGSKIISVEARNCEIFAYDISDSAISYAKEYYQNNNIKFYCRDLIESSFENEKFEKIISFETIEHLFDDVKFLDKCYSVLNPGGLLICSVPNQEKLPFSKKRFPYHERHYTNEQFVNLLEKSEFKIKGCYTQYDINSEVVSDGSSGFFNIYVAEKKK